MAKNQKDERHEVVKRYHEGLKAQRRMNRNYWLNTAFLRGDQWTYFNPQIQRIDQVREDPDTVRATINRLWPGSRTVISKLIQRPLQFEVRPNSADEVAIEGSKVGDSILHAVAREHKWEMMREKFAWAMWKGGAAAICVDWDATLGKPTALSEDGRKLPSGDTTEQALSCAEFVIQPGVIEAHKAYHWTKAQTYQPEVVQAMWDLPECPPADATAGLSSLEKGLVSANHSGLHGPGDSQHTPLTLVLTHYERPNPQNEEGRVEVVVNNKTVWGPKPWPFPFVDHLNLAVGRETMVENSWQGDTVVSAARAVQVAYNQSWSNILQHADIAGNARLLTPQSAIELTEQYSDQPGEISVYLDGSDRPSWLSPPTLPNWLMEIPSALRNEIDDLLGVHDVSRGQAPVNIESGYGLAVLAEQDATPIGKMSQVTADVFGSVGSMVLKLYEDNVKETRKAIITRPGEVAETAEWTGKSLAGQTTALVPSELIAPRSRAAQAKLAESLLQMGLIDSLEQMSRVAELPGERDLIAAVHPDVDRARRENAEMAAGRVRFPESYDDHAMHIREHNHFRKTARYESLPVIVRDFISDHIQAHETLAAEEAAKQQARAEVGGPALAASPAADGSEAVPVDPSLGLALPGGDVPPLDEQTLNDQLSGDIDAALIAQDAEAAAEGAAAGAEELEREEILQMIATAQGNNQ